jgi:hypothetical protein
MMANAIELDAPGGAGGNDPLTLNARIAGRSRPWWGRRRCTSGRFVRPLPQRAVILGRAIVTLVSDGEDAVGRNPARFGRPTAHAAFALLD